MMSSDETEGAFAARIGRTLREGPRVASTPEARARVMAAIRAAAPPVRGAGDFLPVDAMSPGGVPADHAPLGLTSSGSGTPAWPAMAGGRRLWRSPAVGLLAAASIAAVIALVRAAGVEGPIAVVPGQGPAGARNAAPVAGGVVAPAAAAAGTQGIGDEHGRTAPVQFVFVAPAAHQVSVVGDFNDWDSGAAPLSSSGGVWSGQFEVPFGRHDYAFVVDGERWVRDPNAPQAPADEFGSGYSVLVVGENQGEHR